MQLPPHREALSPDSDIRVICVRTSGRILRYVLCHVERMPNHVRWLPLFFSWKDLNALFSIFLTSAVTLYGILFLLTALGSCTSTISRTGDRLNCLSLHAARHSGDGSRLTNFFSCPTYHRSSVPDLPHRPIDFRITA